MNRSVARLMTLSDTSDGASERDLIARIQGGDVDAFSEVYHTYYAGLWRFGTRCLGSPDAGHDVVHTVFLAIWMGRARWNPASLKAYLYGAVQHEMQKMARHAKVIRQTGAVVTEVYTNYHEDASGALPDEATELADLRVRLRHAIKQLPDRQQTAMLLRWVEGLTIPEIAAAMGISHPPVIRLLAKGQQALRKALRP